MKGLIELHSKINTMMFYVNKPALAAVNETKSLVMGFLSVDKILLTALIHKLWSMLYFYIQLCISCDIYFYFFEYYLPLPLKPPPNGLPLYERKKEKEKL
jgi:hypothetical protein